MYSTGGGVKVVEPRFDAITKLMADVFKMVRLTHPMRSRGAHVLLRARL